MEQELERRIQHYWLMISPLLEKIVEDEDFSRHFDNENVRQGFLDTFSYLDDLICSINGGYTGKTTDFYNMTGKEWAELSRLEKHVFVTQELADYVNEIDEVVKSSPDTTFREIFTDEMIAALKNNYYRKNLR